MKELPLTLLRDKTTDRETFRTATAQLTYLLVQEILTKLKTAPKPIETPLASTDGIGIDQPVVLAAILRSGIALLPGFLTFFPQAPIAIIGIRRDEETAEPQHYYTNIPRLDGNENIILLDPMLATGGTASKAIEVLKDAGAQERNIFFVCIVSSPEGMQKVEKDHPEITFIIGALDEYLTHEKLIFPGLGDFGDRFFGSE